MASHHLTAVALGLGLIGSAGCGDDGTALEAVYTIDTWTRNADGCGAEGDSIIEEQGKTALYIKQQNLLGHEFVNGVLCADVATCAAQAADDETIYLDRYYFEDGSDDEGWSASSCSAFCTDGVCNGDFVEDRLTSAGDGAIRIETRTTAITDVAADDDGFCSDDAARAAAADQPCTELEVLTATFEADI